MWWLRKAFRPRPSAKVVLSWPPSANVGRSQAIGRRIGRGASPRDLRIGSSIPATTRVTESSQRR